MFLSSTRTRSSHPLRKHCGGQEDDALVVWSSSATNWLKKKETLFLFTCLAQIRVRRLTSSLADGELVQDFTPALEQRLKVLFHVL